MISSCLSNITERIDGLRTHPVPLQDGSFVLVVRIPRSLRAPHMVTHNGLYQFWIRHDRQKSRMSIHEIKDTCLKVEGLMEKLERFLAKRRQEILEDIGNTSQYIISVTPLFVDSATVNIHDKTLHSLLDNPPPIDKSGQMSIERGSTRFTLNGLCTQNHRFPVFYQTFRSGHLECWLKAEQIMHLPIAQKSLNIGAINIFTFAFLDFGHSGIDPLQAGQERAGAVPKLGEVW